MINIIKKNIFIKNKNLSFDLKMNDKHNYYFEKIQDTIFKNINEILIKINVYYRESDNSIKIEGKIQGNLNLISTLTFKNINVEVDLNWDERYNFDYINNNFNYINNKEGFDIYEYAIEQIYINCPINISEKKSLIYN